MDEEVYCILVLKYKVFLKELEEREICEKVLKPMHPSWFSQVTHSFITIGFRC